MEHLSVLIGACCGFIILINITVGFFRKGFCSLLFFLKGVFDIFGIFITSYYSYLLILVFLLFKVTKFKNITILPQYKGSTTVVMIAKALNSGSKEIQ